ncbi:MAG: hypothetical protein ACIAS6_05515 [Phycisphaerales bacterium JB060]
MNRRTKRRLIVLGIVGGMVVLAGVGGTAVRKYQRQRLAESSRIEGMAAYEEGDYTTAVRKLQTHLRISGMEPEAMTALGDAQRHVPLPNAKHLVLARSSLEQAIALDPENTQAREILLDVHELLGNWLGLANVASELLERDPTNTRFARLRIGAHLQRGANDDALEATREFVLAQEGSIDSHLEMLRVYRQIGRNARQQRAYLEQQVRPMHEGTTSLAVMRAIVEVDADQTAEATRILRQAAEAGPTEGPGARMLLDTIELIGAKTRDTSLYSQSSEWLEQWLENEQLAPHLYEVAAGRAWREGNTPLAVDLALRAQAFEDQSEVVFAWGMLGAIGLGPEYTEQMAALQASFEAATTERHQDRAESWRRVIEAAKQRAQDGERSNEPLTDRMLVANSLGADSVALFYDALDDIKRRNTREAVGRLASLGIHPSWRRARLTLAGLFVSEGRVRDALLLFQNDLQIANLPGGAALLGEAAARFVESGQDTASSGTANLILALLEENPESPVLLAAAGRLAIDRGEHERARELANRLNQTDASQAAISAVQFAAGLKSIDTDLAREVVDRVSEAAQTPAEVAAASTGLVMLGHPDEARDLLEQRATDGSGSAQQWAMARVQLAAMIGDEQGLDTLEKVSAARSGDAQVQIEILSSSVIWSDPARVDPIIARLREAQGEDALEWRVFEARRFLERDETEQSATSATQLLGELFQSERGKRNTRAMLLAADAYERTGQLESELDALRFAADGNEPLAALPRLIDRLQTTGRADDASARLRQFINMGDVSPELRAVRLQLLQRQGMRSEADRDIQALAAAGYPQYILRAGVASREEGTDAALRPKEKSALEADLAPEDQVYAARLLALVGQFDEGLARLEALPPTSDAGKREIVIARFLAEHGRDDLALEQLTEQAERSGDADLWEEAARMLIGMNRADEAFALLDRAVRALPENASLADFRASIDPNSESPIFDRMARFAMSAAEDENTDDGMRALGRILKRYSDGRSDIAQVAAELDQLSSRRATLYPIWPLLIAAYQHLEQPDQAVLRARNAMDALPGDPRPARDATRLLLDMRRYEDAVGVADRWRSMANNPDVLADAEIALGVAEYYRGNVRRAVGLLEPHSEYMLANPEGDRFFLQTLTEALTVDDRMARAEEILSTLLEQDPAWADFMASLAAVAPPSSANTDRAVRWLETVTPMLVGQAEGTATLASSWLRLGTKSGDTQYAMRAIELARSVHGTTADSWRLRAIEAQALEAIGEYADAVAAYERALEMVGQGVPVLLNNAAWLLTSELDEHERAIPMAREAIRLSQTSGDSRPNRANFHHTLGIAMLGSGDAEGALGVFDQGLELAGSPTLRLGRIEALIALDRLGDARRTLDRLQPDDGWSDSQLARLEHLQKVLGAG